MSDNKQVLGVDDEVGLLVSVKEYKATAPAGDTSWTVCDVTAFLSQS